MGSKKESKTSSKYSCPSEAHIKKWGTAESRFEKRNEEAKK